MSPRTRGPFGRLTAGMRQVSRNPRHFRTGRWFLVGEGMALILLGSAGFVSLATHPKEGAAGAPVWVLALTPWHSAVFAGFGVLAVLSAAYRRLAVAVTSLGAVMFVALMVAGAVAAAHHEPGPLGLHTPEIIVHGLVAAANVAILYWLVPDALEGPDWIKRPRTQTPDLSVPDATQSSAISAGSDCQPANADDNDTPKVKPVITRSPRTIAGRESPAPPKPV
ncbi:DUF4383 domain-containing protein [Mycobacterium sp. SMC-17]